jgi:hypothetical protein
MPSTVSKTLAKDLSGLRKADSYKKFAKGYFKNVPGLGGYIYKFQVKSDAKIYLIVNTEANAMAKEYYTNKGYHFLVYNAKSLDDFISMIYNNISEIIDKVNAILDKAQELADERAGGIPHGYKLNDAGEIVIDPVEAPMVRKIFKYYTQYRSVHKVADVLKTNFSHVRDVLHDYRYERMTPPIINKSLLKKARQLMDVNRKNRTT